jgi:hypothetical protein
MLLAYWGEQRYDSLLQKICTRVAESEKGSGGTVVWLRLEWYTTLFLQYSAGIVAIPLRNFDITSSGDAS